MGSLHVLIICIGTSLGNTGDRVPTDCTCFYHIRTEVDLLYSKVKDSSGWMTSWNVKHFFSSPWRVQEIMGTATFLPGAVRDLEIQTRRVLAIYLGG